MDKFSGQIVFDQIKWTAKQSYYSPTWASGHDFTDTSALKARELNHERSSNREGDISISACILLQSVGRPTVLFGISLRRSRYCISVEKVGLYDYACA